MTARLRGAVAAVMAAAAPAAAAADVSGVAVRPSSVAGSATAAAPAATEVLANSLRLSFFLMHSSSSASARPVADLPP